MTKNNNQEQAAREKFEAWYREKYWNFKHGGVDMSPFVDGRYHHLDVDLAWQAWKKALASKPLPDVQSDPVACGGREYCSRHPFCGCGESESTLPECDKSKPAEQQGLFRKFDVRRVDGSDQPGGKHHGCEYFVLDVTHDPHADAALRAYAESCKETHPDLSADIIDRHGLRPAAISAQVAQVPYAWSVRGTILKDETPFLVFDEYIANGFKKATNPRTGALAYEVFPVFKEASQPTAAPDVRKATWDAELEAAALICDKSSLQPAIADRIRALKSTPSAAGQASEVKS